MKTYCPQTILKVTHFCGLFPKNKHWPFVILFLLTIFSIVTYTRLTNFQPDPIFILDLAISFVAFASNISSILILNYSKRNDIQNIFSTLKSFDRQIEWKTYKMELYISHGFVLTQLFVAAFFLLESIISMKISLQFAAVFLPTYINLYLVILIVQQYIYFVNNIKLRCVILNAKLNNLMGVLTNVNHFKDCTAKVIIMENINVKLLIDNYFRIYRLLNLVNSVYGLQVLGIFLLDVLFLIKSITNALSFETGRILLICTNLSGSFIFISLGIILVTSCSSTINKIENATLKTFEIVTYCACSKQNQIHLQVKNQLIFLQHFLMDQKPKFSAANFFNINFRLIFNMLAALSSCVILVSGMLRSSFGNRRPFVENFSNN